MWLWTSVFFRGPRVQTHKKQHIYCPVQTWTPGRCYADVHETHLTHTHTLTYTPVLMPSLNNFFRAWHSLLHIETLPHRLPSSVPTLRHTKERNKTDHQSHGHETKRGEMKAVVVTGNQTYTAEVSGGATSISRRERGREASGAEGGVDGYRLLSEALLGM